MSSLKGSNNLYHFLDKNSVVTFVVCEWKYFFGFCGVFGGLNLTSTFKLDQMRLLTKKNVHIN